ncbi:hypothetical protein Saro_3021 [Novosphingobium aromaticivorans DSM 12444]|uniref:Uncharacterized protein n=1 Tax=Novosphingobium aromaticivorans (strain ATCC 700278 / DSM 12444 / CCUG 56034 / CIP 105152 / NBRC 16084 / F199) TaxID=279238 RepID=Q2G3W7_NOVAD|nr:hypothetical protein [Novosphingobium aromaticivorans]ABD27456.1 hypothetical protein Saro_3021 [Novosphingobium aromaticivorans DSM 12444]SCY69801.1 hypothetical protein SAMN05660666_02534 [Novosphingobium aromaticivorans]
MTPGHNNPPPLEAWSMHIESLFEVANGITDVTNDEQETALDELLDEFRKARKEADGERTAEKKPHDDAAKAVQAKWKPLLDRCDLATGEIKARLTPYRTAKQRAKDEAARKAREEAEARQKAAQDALRSDDLEARYQGEIELKAATKLATSANRIEREATGLRTYWTATITDRRAALGHYIAEQPEAFEALLQELADRDARSPAARREIPGVTFTEQKRAA